MLKLSRIYKAYRGGKEICTETLWTIEKQDRMNTCKIFNVTNAKYIVITL